MQASLGLSPGVLTEWSGPQSCLAMFAFLWRACVPSSRFSEGLWPPPLPPNSFLGPVVCGVCREGCTRLTEDPGHVGWVVMNSFPRSWGVRCPGAPAALGHQRGSWSLTLGLHPAVWGLAYLMSEGDTSTVPGVCCQALGGSRHGEPGTSRVLPAGWVL